MTGKPEEIDSGTDRGNERSDEQALNDLGDVQPGGDRVRKPQTDDENGDKGDRED
jgi:hypothetical protein